MDHVVRFQLHNDVLVHRHHHLVVDGEEPRLAGLQVGLLHDDGSEGDAVVGIFISPIPLAARSGDGEVGLGEIVLGEEEPERGNGDGDQDQDRDDGPGDLENGVVGGAGGLRMALLVEAHHHIDEQSEHEQGDKDDDDVDEVMERGDLLHDRRGGLLEGHLPGRRLTVAGECRTANREQRGRTDIDQQSIEHRHSVTPRAQTSIRPRAPACEGRATICQRRGWHWQPHASWRKAGRRAEMSRKTASPPALLSPRVGPAGCRPLRALLSLSNHKDYCLATLKIWGDCGKCTLDTCFW